MHIINYASFGKHAYYQLCFLRETYLCFIHVSRQITSRRSSHAPWRGQDEDIGIGKQDEDIGIGNKCTGTGTQKVIANIGAVVPDRTFALSVSGAQRMGCQASTAALAGMC
jgi:hypothetical protein